MPTPGERQALLFIAAVAALGIGVRSCRALRPAAGDRDANAALAAQISQVDSAIASGGARRRAAADPDRRTTTARTPSGSPHDRSRNPPPAEPVAPRPVDIDLATAEELDRLPGIGPALAARIIEDRTARGPFGSLEALQQVRGIGPVLAERLRAHVTFSQPPRPPLTEAPAPRRGRRP